MKRALIAGAVVCAMMIGCGKSDEGIAKKMGRKVGETATDFATGVGKGVDTQLAVKVALTPEAEKLGLKTTVAKWNGEPGGKKAISVYLIASEKMAKTLVAKALNREGQEVGRSKAEVTLEKDDAKYVDFQFDDAMDTMLVEKYEIGVAK